MEKISFMIVIILLLIPILTYGQDTEAPDPTTETEETISAADLTETESEGAVSLPDQTVLTTEEDNVDGAKEEQPQLKRIVIEEKDDDDSGFAGAKEQGFKIYLEGGGGTLAGLGALYRINPVFGIGIGASYTPEGVRNSGVGLNLKVETIPLWFDLDAIKINIVLGLQVVMFVQNDFNTYVGADIGGELYIPGLPWLTPSIHNYFYTVGDSMVYQAGLQIRFNI